MARRVGPFEPEYCVIIAELNRRHKLEMLMELWLNAARTARLTRQLDCARLQATHLHLCDIDMQYGDGNMDEEEAQESMVDIMTRDGPKAFWQQRGLLEDYSMLSDIRKMAAVKLCE